jgi:hypothetical protein
MPPIRAGLGALFLAVRIEFGIPQVDKVLVGRMDDTLTHVFCVTFEWHIFPNLIRNWLPRECEQDVPKQARFLIWSRPTPPLRPEFAANGTDGRDFGRVTSSMRP